MAVSDIQKQQARIRLMVMTAVCAGFIMSQFLRTTIGVIAPDLRRDLGLGADELGLLSGSFFLAFALSQIPAGMALDRFGPRRTMASLLSLGIAGTLFFAFAWNATSLIVARFIMGVGFCAVLMGSLSLISRWYPPAQFSTLTGVILAVGGVGSLSATAPLAWLSAQIGWRMSFVAAAGITVLIALALALVVRDAPAGHPFHRRHQSTFRESLAGVLEAARQRDVAPVFVMYFFSYACFISIIGLWGGPYLADVHGLGLESRGRVLLVLALAQGLGVFTVSRLDRVFGTRKWIVVVGAGAVTLLIASLGVWPDMPLWTVGVLFAAMGFGFGFVPVLMAHGRNLFADPILARGMTLLNLATMSGAFVVQYASGLVMAAYQPAVGAAGAGAYRACFGTLAFILAVATLTYLRAGDRPVQRRGEGPA